MKIVLATGGFDPVHSGHIDYFNESAKLGDRLVIGLNSDAWLKRKKGRAFMPIDERKSVIGNLKVVDEVMEFNDDTNNSIDCIRQLLIKYPQSTIIFVNGGDRTSTNVPEIHEFKNESRVLFVFGVGGEHKKNSSSWILSEWKAPKTNRPWGYYRVLHENGKEVKLKELTVEPGICLSMQRHEHRSEFWFVAEGVATVYTKTETDVSHVGNFKKFDHIFIKRGEWHRLCNESESDLKIIEIQYGDNCIEEDIQRA